ncbi:Methyl-accepting chemotaxis protein I (serine chemoreceptor protein) [Salinisphaera sp. LB1]|nr:Methyl-accepting chemotaxis protein I (serine chemoreceptor protein) [Salinisphaera sp. LB1]
MFKSVKTKLGAGFGLILLLVCALGAVSMHSLHNSQQNANQIFNSNLKAMHYIGEVNLHLGRLQSRALKVMNKRDAQSAADLETFLNSAKTTIAKNLGKYYPAMVGNPSEDAKAKQAIADYHAFLPLMSHFIGLASDGNFQQAVTDYYANVEKPFLQLRSDFRGLSNLQVTQADKAHAAGAASASQANLIMWALLGFVVVVTILTTLLMIRMITRPLQQTRGVVAAIGQGRLDNEIVNPFRDEFGQLLTGLAEMQERLAAIVMKVRDGSDSVSVGARQIAAGNDELSTRTQQQAASLEETASSMEQMTATVKQNADNATQADQLARQVRSQANEGGEVVGRAVAAMEEITAASRKIGDIVGLIDDIAFQTNLLALNASVEAARAGEQGRGFAVVATEVRNLASRSANAAKEIKALVADSSAKVADGSSQVALSGSTLEQIVESVTKVSDLVSEMAAAGKEQSAGIEQVNIAVSEMDNTTQKNAALVEESAAAGRSLEEQADDLKAQVASFRVAARAAQKPRTPVTQAPQPDAGQPQPRPQPQSQSQSKNGPAKALGGGKPAQPAPAAAPASGDDDQWATF